MTPEKLDLLLHELTEHEKRYKEGWKNPENEWTLQKADSHRNDVKILRYPYSINSVSGGKHSRFSLYPVHVHPWIELNYMYSGSCIQKVNGNEIRLEKGQILLLNQDTVHELPVLEENDILLNIFLSKNHLTNGFLNRFSKSNILSRFLLESMNSNLSHDDYLFFACENRRRVSLFVKEFFCELYDPSQNSEDILSNLLALILMELIECSHANVSHGSETASSVLYILKYIENNYKTATLESTSRFFSMNPDYLSRLLKKQTGYSFHPLITKQRILVAKQLLQNTDLPVNEVSSEVGYSNITFFYRKFREETNQTPAEYRKKNQNVNGKYC